MTIRAMLAPRMSEHEQRFELLADLGAMIAGEVELDDLLGTFADRVSRALGADRTTLWLIDGATGEIRSRVANLPELAELRVPQGHGVVGHVAATGEMVNITDAQNVLKIVGCRPFDQVRSKKFLEGWCIIIEGHEDPAAPDGRTHHREIEVVADRVLAE